MKINDSRHIISGITLLLVLFLDTLSIRAQSSDPLSADFLDGVLSGMKKDVELDNVIAAMERANSGSRSRQNDVTATLDYLDNVFSDNQGSYSGFNRFTPGTAVLPIVGRLTSRFGYRPSFGRMHKGVDISLHIGDTIVAAMDGTVERVSVDPKGYGLFVCIRHPNGMETRYAHLSRSLVSPGMNVSVGEPIALGGNTGNSTGPHLHFETRVNGTALDPTTMFDFSNPNNVMRTRRSLADLDDMAANRFSPQNYNPASATAPLAPKRKTYVVKTGDTVASVAHKNGISILSLCRLNMLSTNDILQPGRMLKIR